MLGQVINDIFQGFVAFHRVFVIFTVHRNNPCFAIRRGTGQGNCGGGILHHGRRHGRQGCGHGQGSLHGLGDLNGVSVHYGRVVGIGPIADLVTQVGQDIVQGLAPGHRVVVGRAVHSHGPGLPVPGRPAQGHRSGGVRHRGGGFVRHQHGCGHGQGSLRGLGDLDGVSVHHGRVVGLAVDLVTQVGQDIVQALAPGHYVVVHVSVKSNVPDVTIRRRPAQGHRGCAILHNG